MNRRAIFALMVLSTPAFAQRMVSARAGTLYYSEGSIDIDGRNVRAGASDRRPQLEDGQTLTTGGNTEVLLGAGAVMWVRGKSKIQFEDTSLEDVRLSLTEGSAMVEVKSAPLGSHLRFEMGGTTAELVRSGVYRIDAGPGRIRVYSGRAALSEISGGTMLRPGQQAMFADWHNVSRVDRREVDEFHYWSAYRSFLLERESGQRKSWSSTGDNWTFRNSAFSVEFPDRPNGAARAMYLAASEAGLVNVLEGSGMLTSAAAPATRQRVPFRLGAEGELEIREGRSEVFLGIGVVAWMGANSELRIVDSMATSPVVAIEKGSVMIEVANGTKTRARVRVGTSTTELSKAGVYRFDAQEGSLMVYGGEVTAVVADKKVLVRGGQIANLREALAPAAFDVNWKDELYQWAARRSFALYTGANWFMTSWGEPASPGGKYKHKVFGEGVRGGPPQLRNRAQPKG